MNTTINVPVELRDRRQWVLWRQEERKGKPTKVPYTTAGTLAKTNDPATWATFDGVLSVAGEYSGVGFVFSGSDEFFGIDLDACRDPETGNLTSWAQQVVSDFGTYTEVSPSGYGVKLVGRGRLPDGKGHATKLKDVDVFGGKDPEIAAYDQRRFWAMTGLHVVGTPAAVVDCQEPLQRLHARLWSENGRPKNGKARKANSPPDGELETLVAKCANAQDRSAADFNLCCRAIERGWDKEAVWQRVQTVGKFSERGREYFESTWAAAEAHASPQAGQAIQVITNYRTDKSDDNKDVRVPLPMSGIVANVRQLTGDFPRRVDNALFVDDKRHGFGWLTTEASLYGYFHTAVGGVRWSSGGTFVTKPELYAELQRTATRYDAVETLPHEPRIDTHYYACPEIEPGRGDHLRRLLDRFRPSTDIDRDLIQAALMTPGWGGPPGMRPCFVVTADVGRGAGKTTLAEMIGRVWGGVLSFSHREDVNKIKTRLLTSAVLTRRVCLLDNLKSLKFSWSELESMITATHIGGHRLYVGEATRPNTLTWLVTLNGASLSTDMAQRSVIIKIDRPKRSGEWSDQTRQYIDDHRHQIIADIVGALRADPHHLEHYTRWATWERAVLSRLPEPAEAQKVIEERQVGVDVEAEEADHLEEHFGLELQTLGYDIRREWVFIPSRIANRWFCEATNERLSTTVTTRTLKQLVTEGRLKRLREYRISSERGFLWTSSTLGTAICVDIRERLAKQLGK